MKVWMEESMNEKRKESKNNDVMNEGLNGRKYEWKVR